MSGWATGSASGWATGSASNWASGRRTPTLRRSSWWSTTPTVLDDPTVISPRSSPAAAQGVTIAAAARLEAVRVAYGHWVREVTRSRCGLILTAAGEVDGELLGVTLPRRTVIPARPGPRVADRRAWAPAGAGRCQNACMTRIVTVADRAQLGPVQLADDRASVVERMIVLLQEAASQGCDLVVYPELALTTFFPRWFVDDIATTDHFYERSMPNEATQPLFDEGPAARGRLLPRLCTAGGRAGRYAASLERPDVGGA